VHFGVCEVLKIPPFWAAFKSPALMRITKQIFYDSMEFLVTLQYDYDDINECLQTLCNNFPEDVSYSCALLHRQLPTILMLSIDK
jgi:hypothetical protein